jgi:5-methyltetrahydropteroyltriglutamate--homocysteine methyltransferase
MLLPTSLVGSYAQPDWLIDRAKLAGRFPPRTRAKELWRIPEEHLEEAQNSATVEAIKLQEEAGIDIVTDGEIRRESYSNRFATALDGVDIDNPGTALDRSGHPNPVPRVVGDIRRRHAVEVEDLLFLKRHTDRKVKITVPGPFTMSQQAQDDHYGDPRACALAYAQAVKEEIADLFAAGADVVQLDEPYMQARPQAAEEYGLEAVNAALDGAAGTTALHICFGYAAIIHARPTGYSFLPQLKGCSCNQVSLETAQSNLDTSVLEELRGTSGRSRPRGSTTSLSWAPTGRLRSTSGKGCSACPSSSTSRTSTTRAKGTSTSIRATAASSRSSPTRPQARPGAHLDRPGRVHHLAFSVSQATFRQIVKRLDARGIKHFGPKDRGFMDSIYFRTRSGC